MSPTAPSKHGYAFVILVPVVLSVLSLGFIAGIAEIIENGLQQDVKLWELLMMPLMSVVMSLIMATISFPVALIAQFIVGWPVHYVFRKSNAHWLYYAVTGYALSLLFFLFFFDDTTSLTPYALAHMGTVQAIATWYYGKPKSQLTSNV